MGNFRTNESAVVAGDDSVDFPTLEPRNFWWHKFLEGFEDYILAA